MFISDKLHAMLGDMRSTNSVAFFLYYHGEGFGNTQLGDYFDIEEENISFLPAKRELGAGEDPYTSTARQNGKAARIARKMLAPLIVDRYLVDADFEAFTNAIKAMAARDKAVFSFASGTDIPQWYNGDNYAPNSGQLNKSCMRYDYCQHNLGIYTDNPDVVQMLILTDEDKTVLFGRALVWTTTTGEKFMDRIYASDSHIVAFENYAKEQGWIYKDRSKFYGPLNFRAVDGTELPRVVHVKVKPKAYSKYPYMDTMRFYNENGSLCNAVTETHTIEMKHQTGEYNRRIEGNR